SARRRSRGRTTWRCGERRPYSCSEEGRRGPELGRTAQVQDRQVGPVLGRRRSQNSPEKPAKTRRQRLRALYACMYLAAPRPGEVVGLRRQDCHLPAAGWGSLTLEKSRPEVNPLLDRHRLGAW